MSAKIKFKKKEFTVRHGTTVRSALQKLEIPIASVIPTRNGELITDDELIRENDIIKLVTVISGG